MKKLIAYVLAAGFAASAPLPAFAGDKAAEAAQIMETVDATVGLNGLVCDFCSIALNKTFKKTRFRFGDPCGSRC